jgi:hypothetical protein
MTGIDESHFVSRTGTKHITDTFQNGRTIALCNFSFQPDDGPFEALQDCAFCLAVAAERAEKAAAAEAARQLREGFRVVCEQLEKSR